MKFILASSNEHKVLEFDRILKPLGLEILPMNSVAKNIEIDESGSTFAENAKIKAEALRRVCKDFPVIADDSGICVDYLNGEPGIYSARYSGKGDIENNILLLKKLSGVPQKDRTARFVAAICVIFKDGRLLEIEESCEGKIAETPKGSLGFGYDPIFLVGEKTMAELSGAEKDAISHRGKALRRLASEILKFI